MKDQNNKTNEQLLKEINLLRLKVADLEESVLIRKTVELELLESEERFMAFTNHSTDGISVADLEGNYTYVNPAFCKMVGWAEEELLKMTVFDVTADKQDKATFKKTKTVKEGSPVIVNLCRKDRSIFIAEVIGNNISFKGKRRVLGTIRDITKTKEAEKELRESEEYFKALIENSSDVISTIDSKGVNTYQSPSYSRVMGYEKGERIGKGVFELIHPEDKNRLSQQLAKLIQKPGETEQIIFRFLHKDKTWHHFEGTAKNLLDSPSIKGVILNYRDISKSKKNEEEIKKLSTAVEQSANTIVLTDSKGNIEYTNPKFSELTGYTAEEALRQNPRILNAGTQPKEYYSEMWQALVAGKTWKGEFHNKTKSGSLFWEQVTISPIKDDSGKTTNYLAVKEDITDRKKAQEELIIAKEKTEESERKFRELFEKSGDAILIIENGKFIDCNQATLDAMKYTDKKSFLNVHPSKISPDLQSDGRSSYEKADELMALALKNGTHRFEWDHIKSNDELLPVEVLLTTILNEADKKIIHVAWRDITIRKKAQEELIIAKERAEESDRLKSAFLANMSHEIRTPMNGIMGFANLLRQPGLSGVKQQKYISIIERGGKRMLNIINDLVDISKVEAGQMELSISEVNINEQLEYLHTFFKPEADRKGLKLSYTTSLSSEEAAIDSDREKLYAILTNLIKNAIKYTLHGSIEFGYTPGTSTSSVSEDSASSVSEDSAVSTGSTSELEFYVKDTGIGIPKDKQESVFQRFVQADQSLSSDYEGAGLGLSITTAYLKMLGGKIRLESEMGVGSCFFFTIPYLKKSQQSIPEEDEFLVSDSSSKLENLKILVAEDDETSEIYLDTLLEDVNKEILHARTGIEAVELCKNNPDTDLILMDIKMPEMSGYDATRKIREFNKDIVIIAQTAYSLTGDKEKAIAAGCNDYITKPIDKKELMGKIEELIK